MTSMEKIQQVINNGKGEITGKNVDVTYYFNGEQWFSEHRTENGTMVKTFYTMEEVAERVNGDEFDMVITPHMREPIYE